MAHGAVGLRPLMVTWVPRRWRCGACRQTVCPRPAGWRAWQRWTPAGQEAALILRREASFRYVARLLSVTDSRWRRLVDRVVPTADTPWWDQPGDRVLSLDERGSPCYPMIACTPGRPGLRPFPRRCRPGFAR
ncbi:MAG: hypothetical protein OWU33_05080 [Firmicutes bacterium]|nr:hypothetical protein [Bacillota bacterium]